MSSSLSLAQILERLRINTSWCTQSLAEQALAMQVKGLGVVEEAKSPWGLGYGAFVYHGKDHNQSNWFWDGDEVKERREAFLFMAKLNPKQMEVISQEGEANHTHFTRFATSFEGMDVRGCSDKELVEHFSELKQEFVATSRWSYSLESFFCDADTSWLEEAINKAADEQIKASIKRLQELFIHLHTQTAEREASMSALFHPFIKEVERRFNLAHPLGFCLTSNELFSLFEGIVLDREMIRARYEKGFLTIFSAEGEKIFSADEIKQEGLDKTALMTVEGTKSKEKKTKKAK